jgi:hypothetical protein
MLNFLKKLFSKPIKKQTFREKFEQYCNENPDAVECRIYEV